MLDNVGRVQQHTAEEFVVQKVSPHHMPLIPATVSWIQSLCRSEVADLCSRVFSLCPVGQLWQASGIQPTAPHGSKNVVVGEQYFLAVKFLVPWRTLWGG